GRGLAASRFAKPARPDESSFNLLRADSNFRLYVDLEIGVQRELRLARKAQHAVALVASLPSAENGPVRPRAPRRRRNRAGIDVEALEPLAQLRDDPFLNRSPSVGGGHQSQVVLEDRQLVLVVDDEFFMIGVHRDADLKGPGDTALASVLLPDATEYLAVADAARKPEGQEAGQRAVTHGGRQRQERDAAQRSAAQRVVVENSPDRRMRGRIERERLARRDSGQIDIGDGSLGQLTPPEDERIDPVRFADCRPNRGRGDADRLGIGWVPEFEALLDRPRRRIAGIGRRKEREVAL